MWASSLMCGKLELASCSDTKLELNDSNIPLRLDTSLPDQLRPLAIRQDIPYLWQPEGQDGISSRSRDHFSWRPPPELASQYSPNRVIA